MSENENDRKESGGNNMNLPQSCIHQVSACGRL